MDKINFSMTFDQWQIAIYEVKHVGKSTIYQPPPI